MHRSFIVNLDKIEDIESGLEKKDKESEKIIDQREQESNIEEKVDFNLKI